MVGRSIPETWDSISATSLLPEFQASLPGKLTVRLRTQATQGHEYTRNLTTFVRDLALSEKVLVDDAEEQHCNFQRKVTAVSGRSNNGRLRAIDRRMLPN